MGRGGRGGGRSSNDERADSMNPNNPAYAASEANRGDQLNPDHDAYHSSRGEDRPENDEDKEEE